MDRNPGSRYAPTLIVALACLVGVVVGCSSPQRRYEVLSFFFDGVPTPEERAAAKAAAEAAKAEKEGGPAAIKGSRHRPVAERRCGACHGVSERDAELRSYSGIDMRNIDLAWKSCKSCHSNPVEVSEAGLIFRKDAWLHGPVALGQCRTCHKGHRSEFPALLRNETQESVCRSCHDTVGPRTGKMETLDCVACHDPHSAPKTSDALLRGGAARNCAQCHALDPERKRKWLHGPVAAGACTTCHDAHGGQGSLEHVVRPLRAVCLQCHNATDLSHAQHPPDATDECDTCHVPHAAHKADEYLLRERIEAAGELSSVFVAPAKDETKERKTAGEDAPAPPD